MMNYSIKHKLNFTTKDVAGFFAFMGNCFAALSIYIDMMNIALQNMSTLVGNDALERDTSPISRPVIERYTRPFAMAENGRIVWIVLLKQPAYICFKHTDKPMNQRQ